MARTLRLHSIAALALCSMALPCQLWQAKSGGDPEPNPEPDPVLPAKADPAAGDKANLDATGTTTVAMSYEDAVKANAGRRAATDWPGTPVPDTPYGAPHLNPALTPAPIRREIIERQPVPVINDPGVVGANPPLGTLNATTRAEMMGVPVDDLPKGERGFTPTRAEIKSAAEATQKMVSDRIGEQADEQIAGSTNDTRPVVTHGAD